MECRTAQADSTALRRVFLVGCPRSGTTLLQSLMGSHPAVTSFPETHFYSRVVSGGRRGRIGLVAPEATRTAAALNEMQIDFRIPLLGCRIADPRLSQWSNQFVRALDTISAQRQARLWVEKTPSHLYRIRDISRLVPDAVFVHLIRDGWDTTASLFDVRTKHPEIWGAVDCDADELAGQCARRWASDVTTSLTYAKRPGHLLIAYDEVVAHPARAAGRILSRCGVRVDPVQMRRFVEERRADSVGQIVLPWEAWKRDTGSEISRSSRAAEMFSDAQRSLVDSVVESVNRRAASVTALQSC